MGKRGPHPKPASVRIAEGTFRNDRHADADATPGVPEPPKWLDATAKEVWFDVVEKLESMPGLLSLPDGMSLGRYCQDWVEYWSLLAVIQVEGYTVESDSGNLYQHPAVGAKNKAHDRLCRFESKFGMTPSDRVGLRVDKPKVGVRRREA